MPKKKKTMNGGTSQSSLHAGEDNGNTFDEANIHHFASTNLSKEMRIQH
jgi:hypothetical protein